MAQQPLTSAGVQAKITELYGLSDTLLTDQANLIRSDFKNWISNNFILSSSQLTYLSGIDDQWIQVAAADTSCAVQHRLPVSLNPYTIPPSPISKKIHHTPNITVTDDSVSGFSVTGSITFDIIYT
jgi:hypothetical protein